MSDEAGLAGPVGAVASAMLQPHPLVAPAREGFNRFRGEA